MLLSAPSLTNHHRFPLHFPPNHRRTTQTKTTIKPQSNPSLAATIPTPPPSRPRALDPNAIASLLASCSSLDDVKSVHAVSLRTLRTSAPFVGNVLANAYLRFSGLAHARKLFDVLPARNVVTWTTILNGYLDSGLDDEAVTLFEELVETGVQANGLTFVCMLRCCGNRADLALGRQVHASVVKGNWSNVIVDSAVMYFYAQCGELPDASRAFHRTPVRDVVTWTTMISACARGGRAAEALGMFSRMQHRGLRPNEFTLCSVLKACGEEKALGFARQLHAAVVKGVFREDVHIGSSLVTMYVKCGEVSDARLVFDLMPKRNTVTWTSMISGYARNGRGEEALSLFAKMKKRRIFANDLTIVGVISACGSVGLQNLGKEVHGQVLRRLGRGNGHIDSTLIWFYCKCGEYAYAARVLEAMPETDAVSWTAMISGHNGLEHGGSEALRFLREMLREGVEPNSFTYSSALKACAKAEEVACGKWIHGSANKAGAAAMSNVFVGSSLIDMYMKCGSVRDACRVFETMPEKNLVTWKVMVVGHAKNGHCREALKLMYQMQAEGFYADDYVVSTVLGSCGDIRWEEVEHSSDPCSVSSI